MKPASLLSVFVFSLVALSHLLRLVLQVEVVVAGAVVPMWLSLMGLVVTGALAVGLSREARTESPTEP